MTDVLSYKGFLGSVHFSADDNVFYGKIEGINDLITFEGVTVKELTSAFHCAVNEHIKDCMEEGKPVEKSYKGCFNVRISPDLHRKLVTVARMQGVSLNQYISRSLEMAVA
jgi:predicted HicB family RNase H-like nuclease